LASIDVKVVVSAIDRLSAVFKKMGKNIDSSVSKSTKNMSGMAGMGNVLKGVLGGTASAVGTLGIAIGATAAAITAAAFAIKPFITASIEMENSMLGLTTVARAFGITADDATQAAINLAKDGLMSVREAGEGLKNLLATGFELPEAIALMDAFKDSAAFNRQGTLAFGQAIVGATQGVKNQNSIMVDNAGITKNLSVIMKEQGFTMKDLGRITSDSAVRQALLNGLLQEAAIFEGDAGRAAETLGGKLSQLGTKTFELKAAIGDALRPAVEMAAVALGNTLNKALGGVTRNMAYLQSVAVAVGTAIALVGNIVVGVARIIKGAIDSIATYSLDPLVDAIATTGSKMYVTYANAQQKIEDIAWKSARSQADAYDESAKRIADASSKKKSKLERDLEKETESFEREMKKRARAFEQHLADLIWAHIDKRDQLEEDLAEERDDFSRSMADRVRDFKEAMEEMKESHREKVETIKEQIDEETKKQEDADKERLKELEKKLKAEEKALDRLEGDEKTRLNARIAALKRNYEYEVALGESSEEDLFYQLQDRIEEEKAITKQHIEDLVGYKQEELERIRQEEQAKVEEERVEDAKKLAELQDRLNEEVAEYEEALAKKETVFARETAKLQEEHDKRVADLQERLDTEKEILGKHEGDVAAMKDKVRDDDITRLKNQYEEEKKEAEAEHQRRLKEKKEQGAAEGGAYGGAISGALGPKLDKIKEDLENAGKEGGEKFAEGIGDGAKEAGKRIIEDFLTSIKDKLKELERKAVEAGGILGLEIPVVGLVKKLFPGEFRQEQAGGIVPGAVGEPMPIMAHGQERVIPAGVGVGVGGGEINFNVSIGLYAGAETEKRNIARELYAALVQVAQSQNKTVQELMHG